MASWGKRDDMITHTMEPYNAEPPPEALAGRTLTPVDTFFARGHGPIPRLDPDAWRLSVGGLVEHPMTLSLDDLRAWFPRRDVVATIQCAGNRRAGLLAVRPIPGKTPWRSGAISTARWTGVSLADVLARAVARPGAAHVEFTAPDVSPEARPRQPFGGSIPLAKATAGEVLLAWTMNGRPLPAVHGGPVRVVVPGYIGARSVKWVTGVTVRDRPSDNYFHAVAYRLLPQDAPLGPVAPGCDILAPGERAVLPAGPVMVHGYAFGDDDRGVDRVEVSSDGGLSWRPADLDPAYGCWAWRLWRAVVDLPAGEITIVARAWDIEGGCQPESAASVWNPGGYVNNAWPRVRVVVA
ncbi:sulfite oxidase [Actinoallomurus iriomotensis]|uniref:Sulfite oxidase n=1 Tax=Actinoallomurus iriomotensis TaxID=478107 RepID=A0A9W6S0T1_9ACTN|nr:sulfite oxidase [Actinoallomurus iriomotensis]GLY83567.1 sulfite oxidase [Actinoallomurus iriomotensis]